jgi:hypothetical protein
MVHRFQCACGTVTGEIAHPERAMRAVCYCHDCQAYARLLGAADRTLDASGGTDVLATQSKYVRFTSGLEQLACMSLYPKGLLRWYAKCCNTPIANTPRGWKLPYAGMVHTCMRQPQPLEESFPRVQLRVNTQSASGPVPQDRSVRGLLSFASVMARLGFARLRGAYRSTPFFGPHGSPVVGVTLAERAAVDAAKRAQTPAAAGRPASDES